MNRQELASEPFVVLDAIPEMACLVGPAGDIIAVNDRWSRHTAQAGAGSAGLVGSNYLARCERAASAGEPAAGEIALGLRRVLHGDSPDFETVYPSQGTNGSSHYACRIRPLQNGGAAVAGALVIHADVTDAVRNEQALRESEIWQQLHFEQTSTAVLAWDLEFRATHWNNGAERIFGYTHDEALGRHAADLVLTDVARPIVDDIFQSILKKSGGAHSINENATKDGRTIHCEWFNTPLVDGYGRVIGIGSIANDITDRIAGERRVGAILDAATQGLVLAGKDGTIQLGNRAAAEIFGFVDEAALQNVPIGRLVADADIPSRLCGPARSLSPADDGGLSQGRVCEAMTVDGRSVPIFIRAFEAEGTRDAAIVFAIDDLRVAKSLENQARRNEVLLEEMSTIAHIGAWEFDPETEAVTWSRERYAIQELAPGSPIDHQRILQFYPPDVRRTIEGLMRQALEEGRAWEREFPSKTARGRPIWVRSIGRPERRDGKVVKLRGTIQDITKDYRNREDMARLAERLRLATQSVGMGIWDWDMASGELVWDDRMYALYGEERGVFQPNTETWIACLLPGEAERVFNEFEASKAKGEPLVTQFRIRRGDGADRTLAVRAVLGHDDEGNATRMVGVNWDVTEETEREAHLRQAQKMDALGQLTGGIAHDFNNLLAVIQLNLELLAEEVDGEDFAGTLVKEALDASGRGADMTKRLLAFARRQPLEPKSIDVMALLEDQYEVLRRMLPENITLDISVPERIHIHADPGQLQSAILNLVVNAVHAIDNGGTITIVASTKTSRDCARLAADARDDDPLCSILVIDDGRGIPPEIVPRVFEPFFTTKGEGKGTGMGLSMVMGFARQSGGAAHITSEPGAGTTVEICLPLAESVAPAEAPADDELIASAPADGRVLVVEDDPQVRQVVAGALAALGLDVVVARDGKQAKDALDDPEPLALLVTDVMLPGGRNGPDIARDAKIDRPDLKVLFMTGYAAADVLPGAAEAGGDDLIRKPFGAADIRRKVAQMLAAP